MRYSWAHCRTCLEAQRPSDLMKITLSSGFADVYCAVCGDFLFHALTPVGLEREERVFPEGLPAQDELRDQESNR